MSFVEMTSEELEEVRQHHDAMVRMGALEMRADEIRETPRTAAALAPVDLPLQMPNNVVTSIRR